jgi:hypothetical protein
MNVLLPAIAMSRPKYTIIKADLDQDREEILKLWRRNLLPYSEARYAWVYASPSGPRSEGWLAKTSSGEVVGFTGLLYRKMKIGDRHFEVGHAVDLVVDPPHRAFGPILGLQRTMIQSIRQRTIPFIYGFPDRRLERIFKRIGYQYLGESERWTKPLRSEDWVKKYVSFTSVAKISGRLIDAVLRWNVKDRSYTKPDRGQFEANPEFDERFDDLFLRGAAQYEIVGERTAAHLKWRFEHPQHVPYRTLALSSSSGRLHGYIVFFCQKGVARIVDLFAEPFDWLDSLLGELIFRMRREAIFSISCSYMGSAWFSSLLMEWGFHRRAVGAVMMVLPNDNFPVVHLFDRGRWFVTECDRDV